MWNISYSQDVDTNVETVFLKTKLSYNLVTRIWWGFFCTEMVMNPIEKKWEKKQKQKQALTILPSWYSLHCIIFIMRLMEP